MIYLRVKPRVMAAEGRTLRLCEVADWLGDARLRLDDMPVALPEKEGIWTIDALALIEQIQSRLPEETVYVLGDGTGWLHRQSAGGRCRRDEHGVAYALRAAAACVLLAVGGALAIAWFHTDVNMAGAQRALFTAVAGEEASHPLLLALPYALGVGFGVATYYALVGRRTVSPLAVKLREYRESIEKNARHDQP